MASVASSPVAEAVYAKLNVSTLTSLATVTDDPKQALSFPFVWPEIFGERDLRGFGTGALPEIELRVHIFSTYEGARQGQTIAAEVVRLLKDQDLVVAGWRQAGQICYDDLIALPDELINGVKCREWVARFRIYVEA